MAESSIADAGNAGTSVAALVLNWNGIADTIEAVDSLLSQDHSDLTIFVHDNDSSEDEFHRLSHHYACEERVIVSAGDTNTGFARGMNELFARAMTEKPFAWVLLFNNDATAPATTLSTALQDAQTQGADIVATRMIEYDQETVLDNAGHQLLSSGEVLPINAGAEAEAGDASAWVLGACAGAALYKASVFEALGGFDKYFFAGYEDAEFSVRSTLQGYRCFYSPEAIVRHKISKSVNRIRDFDYAVRIQTDIIYVIFKLLPLRAFVIALLWQIARSLGLILLMPLLGRWRLAKVQLTALGKSLTSLPGLIRVRRSNRELRTRPEALYRFINPTLPTYMRYAFRYLGGGEKTVFER